MEAVNAVQLPPGFKFDPDDDVLVVHYLLPRLRCQPLAFEGIIVEADPLSAPPWKLVDKYKCKGDAFFFAAGQARSGKDSRQKRTCAGGGCWKGQGKKTCEDGGKLHVPGTGEEIAWRKYALNFHADGENGSTGWVMHEYAVTVPAELASSPVRAYRIRFSGHGRKRKREPQDSGGDDAGARAMPRRVTAEAAQPPLEDYSSTSQSGDIISPPAPTMVECIGPPMEASPSSGMMYNPLFSVDDVVLLDDIDELLRSFNYNDLSVPEAWRQCEIISPAAPTMGECIGEPSSSAQGYCTEVDGGIKRFANMLEDDMLEKADAADEQTAEARILQARLHDIISPAAPTMGECIGEPSSAQGYCTEVDDGMKRFANMLKDDMLEEAAAADEQTAEVASEAASPGLLRELEDEGQQETFPPDGGSWNAMARWDLEMPDNIDELLKCNNSMTDDVLHYLSYED